MAEEGSVYELEGLEGQLLSLFSRYSNDELRADSKPFCTDFCKLVEEYTSRWQVPVPQLRILEISLIYFTRAASFFTPNCDHVLHTLSSLALSVFELLLFFDQKDFHEEPLKHFTVTFQECHLALGRHQNVHLLQVERSVQGGGPWASSVLQAILSESSLPQNEVDGYISSELPVFFELRVRYLLSCEQRVSEAVALAKRCSRHPAAGQHLFFLQVYLTWLLKTSQHDCLHREVADLNGKDAVHIICSLECEEKDEFLLALCRAFLSQQLRRGDMFYLCDLVLVWSKLHSQLKTSKQALLEECHQLMLSASNVNSIFPFIRAIMQELGEDGVQFCVELCANALESCLPCDVITKSLIYKTIAGLLPSDLEVCRACALLVFFQERSVEAYKMVYLLYMHPDQEYHVESSPIRNHIRFETLQVLKKDLYFDPEFWNLITLRTNCLKLMSEKVVSAALEEIMEDKWILKYCTKDSAFRPSTSLCKKEKSQTSCKKRHLKEDTDAASKRLKIGPGRTRLNSDHNVKKKGNQGSRPLRDATSKTLRRSFWQLDKLQDNGEVRRTTRHSEKNPPKRRIRTPRWLLEDSGTLDKNNVSRMKQHQKHHQSSVIKRMETGQIKDNVKHKPSMNSHLTAKENSKHQKGISLDSVKPANPPQVILELSLPDNELMGTFNEETCHRQRGFPQVLLYKRTVKLPDEQQPAKTVNGKEVILRARDPAMFLQQLHCYARRQKGKGNGLKMQGSVSTITRSSVQGSPPKDPQRKPSEKSATDAKGGIVTRTKVKETLEKTPQAQTTKAALRKTSSGRELSGKSVEMKDTNASRTSAESDVTEAPMLDKFLQGKTITSSEELCEGSAVEMKVTIASQTLTAGKEGQSQGLDKVSKAHKVRETSETTASTEVSQTLTVTDGCPKARASEDVLKRQEQEPVSPSSRAENDKHLAAQAKADTPGLLANLSNGIPDVDVANMSPKLSKEHKLSEKDTHPGGLAVTQNKASSRPADQDCMNDISALTLVTEMVTELSSETITQDMENQKPQGPDVSASKGSKAGGKPKVPHKLSSTSSGSAQELGASKVSDMLMNKVCIQDMDEELTEDIDAVETEESRLEFCCTFCQKVFKGSRVVAHAMFHYRKDECMFCRTVFKDDLLAMMHLSDHIEKLKRIKDACSKNTRDNQQSESKDISTAKTPSKAKPTIVPPVPRSRGRPRKCTIPPTSTSTPDSTPSGSKRLRSNNKPEEEKHNKSTPVRSKSPVHKVNGHIGEKKKLGRPRKIPLNSEELPTSQKTSQESTSEKAGNPRLHEEQHLDRDSATSARSTEAKTKETDSLQVQKKATKREKEISKKKMEKQEKVCCPVDGCAWFTDRSKNRVALLYHALEDHDGEVKPLKLAFRIGNGKCSCCMRVLWSFEHFQHHVERHRLTPRYPCPHQGCPIRFKTGIEMRRHARKHSPLQAACCLPGCSQLFICLWALNLHERDHYASRSSNPDSNEPTGDRHNQKQPDHERKDAPASTLNKTVSVKASHKLKRQNTHKCKIRGRGRPPLQTSVRASLLKQQVKESGETHEPHVLKNLSNKDTSEHPSGPNLRLRQTLRKVTTPSSLKTQRVVSSSLFKHNIKVRHKVKKKQVKVNTKGPKRRGRPPMLRKADENTTTAAKNETMLEKNQKSTDQLTSSAKEAEVSSDRRKQTDEDVKTKERSSDGSKSKRSISKQIKKNHVKQKGLNRSIATTSSSKTQKVTINKMKKQHHVKKRSAPDQNQSRSPSSESDKSKKKKDGESEAKTQIMEKVVILKESAVEEPKSVEVEAAGESPAEEKGKTISEETEETQNSSENSDPAVQVEKVKSKKLHVTKEKKTTTATSDSSKTHKKQKDTNKKGEKNAVKGRKSENKTPLKKTSKSKPEVSEAAAESSLAGEGKPKEESSHVTMDGPGSSVADASGSSNETTSPPAADVEKTQTVTTKKKSNKSNAPKSVGPNKAKRKREDAGKEGGTKITKKKCKDPNVPSTAKKPRKSKSKPVEEVKAEGAESSAHQEEKTSTDAPQSALTVRGYSSTNGQEGHEGSKAVDFKQNLAEYGKKPYMRAPPEVYLDEKYITMPKRRKETLQTPQRVTIQEQAKVSAAAQRQRCAKCFATFKNGEELQSHVQKRNCSELFGFDSDDEGNS
ncbi:uncharacterized protein LOC117808450 [Notolabrus celidotus]|uniref:uncharacterized protein LOC117808450 n=1 Tax=Notolabrus celidotus TaxID=1203425 RepID=UPI00148FD1F7|nr:uncharacterized protein LOC117808450 [Notolabrus celidotus]